MTNLDSITLLVLTLAPTRVFANNNETVVTSTGIEYNLSDFEIYFEDFDNTNFSTSQQVIDYIYEVGFARSRTRDSLHEIYGYTLTEDELELLILNPEAVIPANQCRILAISTTNENYPNEHQDGQRGNAFQHAYWVILMYYNISPTFAIDFAVAHENYDSNPELHKTMDLYNDFVAYNFCVNSNITAGNYTTENLISFAQQLVTNGSLEYIILNYRYLHSIVTYRDTMRTVENYAIGDFYAYTNSNTPYNVPAPQRIILPTDPHIQLG